MVRSTIYAAAAASVLLSATVHADGIYTKNSPVLQVDAKSYNNLIAKSNHTSIVEFYAPWCGHCQNLKPAYEKAAKNLAGLAKVAAVNCDDDDNKPFCGQMGVQGFPTLKIVRPGKKPGKPFVQDYKGARTAKGIVDAVVDQIPNHVKKVSDKDLDTWMEETKDSAKAILFTDKGTTSALMKALSVDFLGSIIVAQIRDKETAAVKKFSINKFPTLIVLPSGTDELTPVVYDGAMKKDAISQFLSQIAPPNPDPAPPKAKDSKKADKKKDAKASSSFAKASASHESAESASAKVTATSETLEDASNPTESPDPKVDTEQPVVVAGEPSGNPLFDMLGKMVESPLELRKKCLSSKASICILALLPGKQSNSPEEPLPEDAQAALKSLGEIDAKHKWLRTNLFPFYTVPDFNELAVQLRRDLSLKHDKHVEIIATNAKKGWYKPYPSSERGYSRKEVEDWVDAIRMGELKKERLPDGLVEDISEEEAARQVVKEGEKVTFEQFAGAGTEGEESPFKVEIEEVLDEDASKASEGTAPEHNEL